MKRYYIGELEEFILLTVASMTEDRYALKIKEVFEERADRKINISAVHSALYRMEEKGYLKSDFSEPEKVRGGKRRRIFEVTAQGVEILKSNKDLRDQFWNLIPTFNQ